MAQIPGSLQVLVDAVAGMGRDTAGALHGGTEYLTRQLTGDPISASAALEIGRGRAGDDWFVPDEEGEAAKRKLMEALAGMGGMAAMTPGVKEVGGMAMEAFEGLSDNVKAGLEMAAAPLDITPSALAGMIPVAMLKTMSKLPAEEIAKESVKAYKLFRKQGDELFPLYVHADKPVPRGEWLEAESGLQTPSGRVKSKIGELAYRPGWHAGDTPSATHIGGTRASLPEDIPAEMFNPELKSNAPVYRPEDQVWAEVEMPNRVDWQSEADARAALTKTGKPIPRTAHITDQVPTGGHYRYKTNPNMEGEWLIGGEMRVGDELTPEQVSQLNRELGGGDLPTLAQLRNVIAGKLDPAEQAWRPGLLNPEFRKAEVSPEDVNMGNLEQFMSQHGLEGAGTLSPIENVDGFDIPGGLDGDFSYADLIWLKANPIDASKLPRDVHTKLQQKMSRATDPTVNYGDDQVELFNRYLFGMLSPNQPLTPNEFEFSVLRQRSPEDIEALGNMIDWEPGETVSAARRKAANDRMAEHFGTQAKSKGGLGLKGSADYTNLAELAKMYRQDPDFFIKKPDESWANFNERVMSQTRGLSSKVAAFSTVWQDPLKAAISAVDRHMAREFLPELFKNPGDRAKWEAGVTERWNALVDQRKAVDADLASGKIDEPGYKNAMKLLPKGDPQKAQNLDEVLAQQGGDKVFMERVMSILGGKNAKFRSKKTGGVNPNVPEHLAKAKWIHEPESVSMMSDAYKRAQEHNNKLAEKDGLGLFSSQWREWDKIRRRLEPHEVMYPGLHKLPKMPTDRVRESQIAHREAGYMNSSKEPYMNPETGEVDMRLKPTRKGDIEKMLYWTAPPAALAPLAAALTQQQERNGGTQ